MRIYCRAHGTLLNACGGLNGKEIWKWGVVCCVTDAICCTAETNTTL